jgi:hypothetical protein
MAESGKGKRKPGKEGTLPTGEVPPAPTREVEVPYRDEAPKRPPGQQIHPRRKAPPVPNETDGDAPAPSPPGSGEAD